MIIYPDENYDSFISLAEADTIITENVIQYEEWLALPIATREIYLRIATTLILNVTKDLSIETYVAAQSCLPKACALVAAHNFVYGLSSEVNPNTGLVSKEKAGDLEVSYFHGNPTSQAKSRVTNPFPITVTACLNSYGAQLSGASAGFYRVTLERA